MTAQTSGDVPRQDVSLADASRQHAIRSAASATERPHDDTSRATGAVTTAYAASGPALLLSVSPARIPENGGVSTVTVSTSDGATFTTDQTIRLFLSGTAEEVWDYTIASESLTLLAGRTSVTTTVTAVQDRFDDNDETVILAGRHDGIGIGSATITIDDDDDAPRLAVSLSHTELTEGEDDALTVTFRYAGTSVFALSAVVYVWLSGTATEKVDYQEARNPGSAFYFYWDDIEKSLTFPLIDDDIAEPTETIVIDVEQRDIISDVEVDLGTWTARIIDDDTPPPTLSLSAGRDRIAENGGTSEVTVSTGRGATFPADQQITLDFTGTATLNVDYVTIGSPSMTLPAGDTAVSIFVASVRDRVDDDDETIIVTASHGGMSIGSDTIIIVDDDDTPPLTLSASPDSIAENGGTSTIKVATLDGATFTTDQEIEVDLTGTATLNADYVTVGSPSMTLPAGDTAVFIHVVAVRDKVDDDGETVIVAAVHGGVSFGSETITIVDDDGPPVLSLSVSPDSIGERDGESTVTVSTGSGSTFARDQTIQLSLGGTARNNGDYTIGSRVLTLPAEGMSVTTRVKSVDDTQGEPHETVVVTASRGGTSFGSATVTIYDDDAGARPGLVRSLGATAGDGEVVLEWKPLADVYGAPVIGYEYRYAPGSEVPDGAPWHSLGVVFEVTITGLVNGLKYAFEVRGRNGEREGEAQRVQAVPVGLPGAPESLTATGANGEVVLGWNAPAEDGGAPVTGYEYRYAAGSAVPDEVLWHSAGPVYEWTVTELVNGQQYAFEVRARNRGGAGSASGGAATPLGRPAAPASLTAVPGDGQVVLAWSAPADDGGAPITGYEYRYVAGTAVADGTGWQAAGLVLEWTVTGLSSGQQYAFEVRARNREGEGAPRGVLAVPLGPPGAPPSLTATAGDGQVVLAWSAPADDGGAPVIGYEYRYAAGRAVPDGTPWHTAGLALELTVTGLSNGQPYAFEVRARNRAVKGTAQRATATPLGRPSAPASLAATAGEGEVALAWREPEDDGGTPVTSYEYRHAAGDAVPDATPWRWADPGMAATVTGLENETRYTFEVRARNRVGPGQAALTTALPLRLRAELFALGAAAEGEVFAVGIRREGGLSLAADAYLSVVDNAFPGVSATDEGRSDGLGRHRLAFPAGESEVTVTVTVAFDGERRQDRVLTVTLDSARVEVDGVARAYEPLAPALVVQVEEGDAGLAVADARVQGDDSALEFRVSLDRTRDVAVQLDYATEDGSARAGVDYSAVSGTLTIGAGGREAIVVVPVLPALHVTGERTLTLRLSRARNAVIEDGAATGTIARESPLAKAWLARFGRTASDHAAQAIARRLEGGERGAHVTVAGLRLDGAPGRPGAAGGALGSAADNMAPSVREALAGSSFHLQAGAQRTEGGGKAWAAWGDVSATHFEADARGLALSGDVTTGTVGLDRGWRRLLVGLALSRSSGQGAYGGDAGAINSTLTSAHPYVRYRLAERFQMWGAMGRGQGRLQVTPERGAAIETDLSNDMAVLGGRLTVRGSGAPESSLEVALRSDVLWTRTSSEEAGVLAEATGTASRGRFMLESAGRFTGMGGVVRPSVEGGLRYDGGDAERGTGLEVGAGLDWVRGRIALRFDGRLMLAYSADSYEEWGYSGSLIYEPGYDGRGLRMRFGFGTGGTASGLASLWGMENAAGLVRQNGPPPARRPDAEVGFGIGGKVLWYPYLAADATGGKRLGLELNTDRGLDIGLELSAPDRGPRPGNHALALRGNIRF